MGRLLNRWGRNYLKSKGINFEETKKGIYLYNKNNEIEDKYDNWEDFASYNIPTSTIQELAQYKKRNHHLRRK